MSVLCHFVDNLFAAVEIWEMSRSVFRRNNNDVDQCGHITSHLTHIVYLKKYQPERR